MFQCFKGLSCIVVLYLAFCLDGMTQPLGLPVNRPAESEELDSYVANIFILCQCEVNWDDFG